jgi:hypothetical protein
MIPAPPFSYEPPPTVYSEPSAALPRFQRDGTAHRVGASAKYYVKVSREALQRELDDATGCKRVSEKNSSRILGE